MLFNYLVKVLNTKNDVLTKKQNDITHNLLYLKT